MRMKKTCFYFSQLPGERAKQLYRAILYSVREQRDTAVVERAGLNREEIRQVLYAVRYDYPELFYMTLFGEGCSYTLYENGDRTVQFRYLHPLEEQRKKIQENEEFIRYLLSHVPDKVLPSQYLTALWLHDLVAKNVRYDHAAREAGAEERPEAYSIEGSVHGKKAVCSGIAQLYMMLCERMGIWCTYVAGETHMSEEDRQNNVEGAVGRHAWNLLRLDGIYTYVDVTWDLQEDAPFISHYYFGMSEEQCRRERTPDRMFPGIRLPVSPTPNPMNYYVHKRCYFRSVAELRAYLLRQLGRRKELLCFQLDPRGMSCGVLCQRVREWIEHYLKTAARHVASWTVWYHETMLVFRYQITYR